MDAVAYLSKPLSFEELRQALAKAKERLDKSMVLVNQISVYSNSIKDYFHNGLLVFIKNYFRVLLVSLINLAPILLFLISNVVILSTCLFLYFILINPFVLIFDVIYFNYIFDISINKEYYPDIFEKGLFKQKDAGK